jgi:hypothetical protein
MAYRSWHGVVSDIAITTAGTSDVLVDILIPEGAEFLWAEIENNDHKSLDSFRVLVRPHSGAAFHIVASAASDYSVGVGDPILGVDSGLMTLVKGTSAQIKMHVKGLNAVRFDASSASGSDTTMDCRWSIR